MKKNQNQLSVFSFQFWRSYWITLRPYLFFVSGSAGLVGLSFTGIELYSIKWILLFVISFMAYGLGQAITDCFQLDTDSISSPYRPLTQGKISPKQVIIVTSIFLLGSLVLLQSYNMYTVPVAIIMIAGMYLYTFFKRRFWGGPPWLSIFVAIIPIFIYIADNKLLVPWEAPKALYWLMGSVYFNYAIFVILGYYKDISADSKTNYNTIVVKYGWKTGIVVSLISTILCCICALIPILQIYTDTFSNWLFVIAFTELIAGMIILFYAHYQMYKLNGNESKAYISIANTVRGFVLVNSGAAALINPKYTLFAIVFWIFFEIFLIIRPEKKQV